jgi:hypothetical protein
VEGKITDAHSMGSKRIRSVRDSSSFQRYSEKVTQGSCQKTKLLCKGNLTDEKNRRYTVVILIHTIHRKWIYANHELRYDQKQVQFWHENEMEDEEFHPSIY